jgi:hypothetical protein
MSDRKVGAGGDVLLEANDLREYMVAVDVRL